MDESLLRKAEMKRAQLLEEVARLETFIEMYRKLNTEDIRLNAQPMAFGQLDGAAELEQLRRSRLSKQAQIEEAVFGLLRVRQPMGIAELLEQLTAANLEVGGSDPKVNLSSILSRSTLFTYNRSGGGWFLATAAGPVNDFSDTMPFDEAPDGEIGKTQIETPTKR